jgi:hypothetical protein
VVDRCDSRSPELRSRGEEPSIAVRTAIGHTIALGVVQAKGEQHWEIVGAEYFDVVRRNWRVSEFDTEPPN